MLPINTILCPTDFSEPSGEGVKVAIELAEHFSAEIVLVNVVSHAFPIGAPAVPPGYKIEEYMTEMTRFGREKLAEIQRDTIPAQIECRTFVTQGSPPDEIIERAEDEGADMIVIATHGWTGWRKLVFGSVADKVIRMAQCPVLTVTEPRKQG
ncbi:MAG: universal stress protein [Desulfobacterales bacterium]